MIRCNFDSTCPVENGRRSLHRGAASACGVNLCAQTSAILEAIRLTQLGARAGLVSQLTGLEKAVANRLYRQLHGRPSPPGQLPFTDSWYLKQNRRMAHATLVWQLSQRFAPLDATPARRLIDVYECYRWLEPKPLLDITRVAFVPHLVAVHEWQEQTCSQCGIRYLLPTGSVGTTCWDCQLYLRHRCRHCGTSLTVRPKGRHREICTACQRARHRKVAGTWP
ncbi:MAG: hypothetical protein GY717_15410 [Rhodobacteraceae bacterium]|nr:hypothetical protein [Paracoccaceae bacterium]